MHFLRPEVLVSRIVIEFRVFHLDLDIFVFHLLPGVFGEMMHNSTRCQLP